MSAVAEETRIISADDHLDLAVLPPTLWTERVPASMRERVPQVVDTPDGKFWSAEGRILGPYGRRGPGLIQHGENLGIRPGQPAMRLEDMDRDGIWTHVIYGPPTGISVDDEDLLHACERAYNDWTAEFNAADPDRLVALPMISATTPAAAAAELVRVTELGHRGAVLQLKKGAEPLFDLGWDPFFAEAASCGIPLHIHLGGGTHSLHGVKMSWRQPAFVSIVPMQLDEILVGLIFCGHLERHPEVTLVLGESGLGWIPYVLERMDHEYHKYFDLTTDYRLSMLPSELFRRQVVATYEADEIGLELVDRIGIDNVMWASDYPHGDSTWPNSRRAIAESVLGKLDPAVRRKILWDTAARLYKVT